MNQKEKDILKLEQDFKDTLENDIIKQQRKDAKIIIKDIQLVGQATWKDQISGKPISENIFIVEKEVIEVDENGNERRTGLRNYYLGNKCIAGDLGNNQPVYGENFINFEPDKIKAVNELLDRTSEQEIGNNSLKTIADNII